MSIRHVPMNYVHPVNEYGNYVAMFDKTYPEALKEWAKEVSDWKAKEGNWKYYNSYDELMESKPDPELYRHEWSKDAIMGIQYWEECSEGTPVTPVFPDTPEGKRDLAEWAAENATTFADFKTDADNWYNMLFGNDSIGVHHTIANSSGGSVTFI